MKHVILGLLFFLQFSIALSQNNQWTWMGGDSISYQIPVYGTKGVPSPANRPGSRNSASSWTDKNGDFWIFGGYGFAGQTQQTTGFLNDLWKYTKATGQWTWISGNSNFDQKAQYGIKGISSSTTTPSSRYTNAFWTDPDGNIWLFGGYGFGSNGTGYLDDLWKFSPSTGQWTWMYGVTTVDESVNPGQQGIASPGNNPGGRDQSVVWTDAAGDFWLYGGTGFYFARGRGYNNDLWKYSRSSGLWTWISGNSLFNQPPAFGQKGIPGSSNHPGGRFNAGSWVDKSGSLWLFGGGGYSYNLQSNTYNDLWKFDTASKQWTWMNGDSTSHLPGIYGEKGISSPGNKPGARSYVRSFTDSVGNLCLYGGNGFNSTGQRGNLNDIWRYSIGDNAWTWIGGDTVINQNGYFETQGTANVNNRPAARLAPMFSHDSSGNFWIFGGSTITASVGGNMSDLWKYTISDNSWTFLGGEKFYNRPSNYGTRGIPTAETYPGKRDKGMTWTDKAGNLWLFGGSGEARNGEGRMNDMWVYTVSTNQWTWVNGDSTTNGITVFGTRGQPSPANTPGARFSSVGWTDADGNFWLHGGNGITTVDNNQLGADLWKYDPVIRQWAWMAGSNVPNQRPVPGTKGVAAPGNYPGSRQSGAGSIDKEGNLWLFGGSGHTLVDRDVPLNDVWKYNISSGLWTWLSGDLQANAYAVFGTRNVPAPGNKPAGRMNAITWSDPTGNLWTFGGWGYTTTVQLTNSNELWKFTPSTNMWTWVNGGPTTGALGRYGTQGVSNANNQPGQREYPRGWSDQNGDLMLFGGFGYGKTSFGELNDIWKFSLSNSEWTWVAGDSLQNPIGTYGKPGSGSPSNNPGGREASMTWTTPDGKFWLFGGYGFSSSNGRRLLNDLWQFAPIPIALPAQLLQFSAEPQPQKVLLRWTTASEQNTSDIIIERSTDGNRFDSLGYTRAQGTSTTLKKYNFTDQAPLPLINYYRLKFRNLNGTHDYSSILKVVTGQNASGFVLLSNPVQNTLSLKLTTALSGKVSMSIYDMQGHVLAREDRSANPGENNFTIGLGKLSAGSYLLEVNMQGFHQTRRFIKQ